MSKRHGRAAGGWRDHPRRRRGGFTLVELLVVVGITAVLVAILLPALGAAKRQARDMACGGKLRQLVAACLTYKAQNGKLPPPLNNRTHDNIYPSDVLSRHLNDLAPFLGYPKVSNATPPETLPSAVLSTLYEDNPNLARGPVTTSGEPYWYTGYSYFGRLDESPKAAAQIIKPERVASESGLASANGAEAVLYADTVNYYGFTGVWLYGHARGTGGGPTSSPDAVRGMHVGHADGSVVWKPLTPLEIRAETRDKAASYKLALHTGDGYYYWWN